MDKLKLENEEKDRRISISIISDAGSKFEKQKKIKYGGPLAAIWGMFADFTNNSTVHGVRYLGERRRHWSERTFWIIAFLISITGCSVLIYNIYNKWQLSPVIISVAEKSTPIWEIPFPAITICPQTKVKNDFLNFTKVYTTIVNTPHGVPYNLTTDELNKVEALAQVCDLHLFKDRNITSGIELNEIVPTLQQISPDLNQTLMICFWRNEMQDCNEMFSETITEEGFCYTFNMLDSSEIFKEDVLDKDFVYSKQNKTSPDWSLQGGYKTRDIEVYPNRVLGTGAHAGLNIVLKLYKNDTDYICRGPAQGLKIFLHTPDEIPRVSKQYFHISLKQEVVVSVKPKMITTSDGLLNYPPERRQCFFNDEKFLKFFKIYSQSNCELECLSNFTLNACGCVKFSMPRDSDTPICGQELVQCYNKAEDDLMKTELIQSLESGSEENKRQQIDCNCLPSCTSIKYDVEITQNEFKFVELFEAYGADLNEFPGLVLAKLTIFFKEPKLTTTKRSEIYSLNDFMADCGGILGLFMGVSLFSIIELIYYFTLRLACNRQTFNETINPIDEAPGKEIKTNVNHQQTITLDNGQTEVNQSDS